MVRRIEIAPRQGLTDPRGEEVRRRAASFLGLRLDAARTCEVYLVDAGLTDEETVRILEEFVDPVLEVGALDRVDVGDYEVAVTVGLKPGVTDPVGKSAAEAIRDTLGRQLGDSGAVFCSRVYFLSGISPEEAERLARELLANPVIQTVHVQTRAERDSSPPDLRVPRVLRETRAEVVSIDLDVGDSELERISRKRLLYLSLEEMRALRDHFGSGDEAAGRAAWGLGAAPTDVELECLAQTWSEHCKHKIFNARITYHESGRPAETVDSLFRSYIRRVTEEIDAELIRRHGRSWLVSVFHDNAGVVAFDEVLHLVYKVETHNSPSALDPYGGAMTGIVGVNRDPFGTGRGADLLVNVWGYCFAPPERDGPLPAGLLHPARIRDGVHQGVIDGGNQSGIPYGRGWERFDERYLGKPLVFCGTVGALPVTLAGRPGEVKVARPGDSIVMVGGRIGADGIHGATFSSAVLDEAAPVQAVQIGDPITQKRMFDFLLEARDLGLYEAITDNGAGGLSSSVGEMARGPGGARLDLTRAPLKYPGLAPWEILVSEAQERMTLAVAPEQLERFLELAHRREVEATVLGEFDDGGYLQVEYDGRTVGRLGMDFLHEGDPELRLVARWKPPRHREPPGEAPDLDPGRVLLDMLGRLNLRSGEARARHYDHEVKGLSVVKPYLGVDGDVPADATVFLARHGSLAGFVLSEGVNPHYSDIDTHAMATAVVDEALRRQLAAGARLDRIAMLDNFCWPDPERSPTNPDGEYKLAQLVRACRGLYEATRAYGVPLISGKDSMKNDSTKGGVKISVPPTLLVSAIGRIDDVRDAITLELEQADDVVFLLGTTSEETGGSELLRYLGELDGKRAELGSAAPYVGNRVPRIDVEATRPLYDALHTAIRRGLVRSATTPVLGGWAPAWARAIVASHLGLELEVGDTADLAGLSPRVALFSESGGRFLVTTRKEDADRFATLLAGQACQRVGRVTAQARLRVTCRGQRWLDLDRADLAAAYRGDAQHG